MSKLDQLQDKIALAIKTALGVKSVVMLANQESKLSRKYQDRRNVMANKSNIQNVDKSVAVRTSRTSDGDKTTETTEVEVKPSVKGAATGAAAGLLSLVLWVLWLVVQLVRYLDQNNTQSFKQKKTLIIQSLFLFIKSMLPCTSKLHPRIPLLH